MVVLIIGIMASAIFVSVDLSDAQETRSKLRQLQIMMRTLSDSAIIEGKVYGIRWRKGVATAMVYTGEEWQEFGELEETRWGSHLDFKVVLNGVLLTLTEEPKKKTDEDELDDLSDDESEIDLNALTEEEALLLELKKQKERRPQVFFLPTGLWEPTGSIITSLNIEANRGFTWGASGAIRAGYGSDE